MEIEKLVRAPLVKILSRIIGYGVGSLLGAIGIESMEKDSVSLGLAQAVTALIILVATGIIDKWHHNKDIAEEPPK